MKTRILTLVVTAVALCAAIGVASWNTPPTASVSVAASPPADAGMAPVQKDQQAAARGGNHYAQLGQAIERAMMARDPHQRETAFTVLLPELLQAEPQRVPALLQRQPAGEPRDALRDAVARQWVRIDREAAVQWMRSLEDEAERRQAAQVAVASLAAFAPDQAIDVADQFGVGRDNGYLEHLVQIWAETSLADAERWLATQPDDARTAPLRAHIERVREQRMASGRG